MVYELADGKAGLDEFEIGKELYTLLCLWRIRGSKDDLICMIVV